MAASCKGSYRLSGDKDFHPVQSNAHRQRFFEQMTHWSSRELVLHKGCRKYLFQDNNQIKTFPRNYPKIGSGKAVVYLGYLDPCFYNKVTYLAVGTVIIASNQPRRIKIKTLKIKRDRWNDKVSLRPGAE